MLHGHIYINMPLISDLDYLTIVNQVNSFIYVVAVFIQILLKYFLKLCVFFLYNVHGERRTYMIH